MPSFPVGANEISQPLFVPDGSLVTVTPVVGATVVVEYTLDSGPTVFSGLATWVAWPNGAVTAPSSDMLNEPAYIRVRPTGGAVSVSYDTAPGWQQKSQFLLDWGGANRALATWAYAQSFQLVSAARDTNGAITTASIVWPDGATGTFTTDTASTAFPGAIDAWHATYVLGTLTKTVTQPAVTRDANGAVTAQPAITIS